MRLCPKCKKINDNSSNFCINCGTTLINNSIKCSKCGVINEPDSNFCVSCGNNLNKPTREEFEKEVGNYRKKINNIDLGLGEELNQSFRKKINKELDDIIIREHGTPKEKAKLNARKEQEKIQKEEKEQKKRELDNKLEKARKLIVISELEEAKSLINELLQSEDYYYIFHIYFDLYMYYMKEQDYDNAIAILEEHIQVAEELDEDTDNLKSFLLDAKESKLNMKTKELRQKATSLYYMGHYEDAIPLFNVCIKVNDDEKTTYLLLADIYHRNKDFESEVKVLEKGVENITFEYAIHNDSNSGVGDKLENVKYYLEHGKFKWDCLPLDDNSIAPKIKKAKAVLKENEQRGIELLEDILEEGTFNNTVYYTLYRNYLKNNKFNAAISIADEAINNLGLYSSDKLEKWTKYKDKAIAKKEKELSK